MAELLVERERARGYEAVAAVHSDGDQPHIHVVVAARPVVEEDGKIRVIRARGNVAYTQRRDVHDLRRDVAQVVNDVCDPAVRFYGGKDKNMDEPGITGRRPHHRLARTLYEREGWRDIPDEERTQYAEKHKLERKKKAAKSEALKKEKTARKEARLEKDGAVLKDKVQRPFKLANDIQQKMVYTAGAKANFTLPQGWRKLDGGDLMAVMRSLNAGDLDGARKAMAEAQRRAELLAPVIGSLLAELEAARAQTQRSPEPAAPAPAPDQGEHHERDGDREVDGAGRGPERDDRRVSDGRGRPAAAPVGNTRGNRRVPPPAARNRVRHLSDVPVVPFGNRATGVLQADVPDKLGDIEARGDHPLRRSDGRATVAALRGALSRVTAAEVVAVGDAITDVEKWRLGASDAQHSLADRLEWQEALDEALAAGDAADQRQQFAQAINGAGRDIEDRVAWQVGIDGAMAAGERWQLSARIALTAETVGADIIARQAWTDGLEALAGLDNTTIPALTASLNQAQQRRGENVARRTRRTDRIPQSEDRSGTEHPASGGDDHRNLEEHIQAGTVGWPESGAAITRSDGRLADPDQPRPGTTGGRPAGDKRDAIPPDIKRNEPVGRRVNLTLRKSVRNIHRVLLDETCVAILMPQQGQHYIVPMDGNIQNAGPLIHLHSAPVDASKDINTEISARFEEFYLANPKMKPPEKPVEAPAPKVAPLPAPPPPAQEATMAKITPKPPRQPTEGELRNADIEKIIGEEPNIRQAWSDIDLRLAQAIDQMKHGDLADALINGSLNRYDLAHAAGYLSKENLARINARHHEKYEIDPPKNPSREVIEKQEKEKQTATDRMRAAVVKLASVPAAKDAFEAGKRLMEDLTEMMVGTPQQVQKNTDKRHPDQKHPDEITPEDFKQLVREERERQMKDPAVHFHRDRDEVVVAKRLAEKRRALEELNSGWQQQPPIIIVVQQQQGEDLDRLIGRLTDPSKLHALTSHLKTVSEDMRYPATRPVDLIPPASMTRLALTVEQLVAAELGRHQPKQATATSPSASPPQPVAPAPASLSSKVIEWPLDHIYSNWKQRQDTIRQRLANADPRQLEEWRHGTRAAISAQKEKGAPARPTYEKAIAHGLRIVEAEMIDRGILSPDQSVEGRLRAEQERRRQQQARGGGRVD